MSKLKRYCCALFLLVFGITSSYAQQVSVGSNVFLNSTTFDFDGNTNPNSQFASAQNTLELGFSYGLSDKLWVQHRVAYNKQMHEVEQLFEYSYIYSFAALQNNLCYNTNEHWYVGVGVPLNFTLEATQFNAFGSLDLLAEENMPSMLYGYTALVGYKTQVSEKLTVLFDVSRNHFLNSMDNDPGQKLIAKSYVFSLKAAFNL
jgi:hypothetical protein